MAQHYDKAAILEKVAIADLFLRDSIVLKRNGSSFSCCCPFHMEKTPSCSITPDKNMFYCFGCGTGGDIFAYWQTSRSCDFKQAVTDLASIAGILGHDYNPTAANHTVLRKTLPAPEPLPQPLTGTKLQQWLDSVAALAASESEIARIAEWRGFSLPLMHWAIEHGIIGLKEYYYETRESFLVERPEPADPDAESQSLIPVSVHHRLAPHTKGNDHKKQSWRFAPKQCGSWPIIFGDYTTAKYLFILEGQWDFLAIIDLMGWHIKWPKETAVVGLRGAQSGDKFIEHYVLNPDALAFAFADADNAGATWTFKP